MSTKELTIEKLTLTEGENFSSIKFEYKGTQFGAFSKGENSTHRLTELSLHLIDLMIT